MNDNLNQTSIHNALILFPSGTHMCDGAPKNSIFLAKFFNQSQNS